MGRHAVVQSDRHELSRLVYELNSIGVSVNQISRTINEGILNDKDIDQAENLRLAYMELRKRMPEIDATLKKWR